MEGQAKSQKGKETPDDYEFGAWVSHVRILVCSMTKCFKPTILAYCYATINRSSPGPTDRSHNVWTETETELMVLESCWTRLTSELLR